MVSTNWPWQRLRVTLEALWLMARPPQLLLISGVYLLGLAIAWVEGYPLDLPTAVWGLVVLLPTLSSIHYANEYVDVETDALTIRTPYSGGSGAISRLGVSPRLAWRAVWVALAIGWTLAAVAFALGYLGPAAIVVLVLGTFFGWMYSLPPLQLAWHGWGELTNALLGGVVMVTYGYVVLAGRLDPVAVWASLPFTLLVFTNLLATTWCDRAADAQVGKFTLATRWPVSRLQWLYGVASVLAVILVLVLPLPVVVKWASLLVVPFLVWGSWAYTRRHSPFPTVAAMVLMLLVQLPAWLWVGLNAGG